MKNKLLFLLLPFIMAGLLTAQSLTLISPNGGEVWDLGSTHNVRWTHRVTGNVILELMKNGVSQGTIYNGPSLGSYSWPINTLPNGNPILPGKYRFQIKSVVNPTILDQSDADFTIRKVFKRLGRGKTPAGTKLAVKPCDLTLGKFSLEPRPRYVGDRVIFRAKIKNIGEGRAGPSKAEVKITGPRGFRTLHTTNVDIPRLDPGQEHEYYLGYKATHTGLYKHLVKVDINQRYLESNENNNAKSTMFAVNPLPELIVCLKFRDRASFCRNHSITAEVINSGDKESPPCTLHFYVKDKGTKTYQIPKLQPKTKHTVKRTHKWCKLWKTGWKTIWAHIDKEKTVHEKNPNNNYIKTRFKVLTYHLERGAELKYHCSNGLR